jgi:hypothetical protein
MTSPPISASALAVSIVVLLWGSVTSPSAFGFELTLCDSAVPVPEGAQHWNYFGPDGEALTLHVSDTAASEDGCQSLTVPLNESQMLWGGMVSADVASAGARYGFILQGAFSAASSVTVSEIIALSAPSTQTPQRLRYGENLIRHTSYIVFGEEERAQWEPGAGLSCRPGDSPAGVQFTGSGNWPDTVASQLYVEAEGQGNFGFAVADPARIAREAPLAVGAHDFAAEQGTIPLAFPLPANEIGWQALTISCPRFEAELNISRIAIIPNADHSQSATEAQRSAWLWSPTLWQDDADQFWSIVEEQELNEVYITVPVSPGGSIPEQQLDLFMEEAAEADLSVWPVIGDRRDVVESSWDALQERITAYARFNGSADDDKRLQGVQLDIEPYLLAGFALNPSYWRERYLETVALARATVGPFLNIDLVVPVWWGNHPQFGPDFLEQLTQYQTSITVMNYRTDVLNLINGAEPFLRWGDANSRKVSIGLEAGSIADEQQQLFRPASSEGELWLVELGHYQVLLLFDETASDLPGIPFERYLERLYSGNNITFAGDLQRLNTVADFLESTFSNRPSFRGISLHGLDEIYREAAVE